MSSAPEAEDPSEKPWLDVDGYARAAVAEMARRGWSRLDFFDLDIRKRLAPIADVAGLVEARLELRDTSPPELPGGYDCAFRFTFESGAPVVLDDLAAYIAWIRGNRQMLRARAEQGSLRTVIESSSANPSAPATPRPRRAL